MNRVVVTKNRFTGKWEVRLPLPFIARPFSFIKFENAIYYATMSANFERSQ